jgi:hypothetical protein
LIASNDRIWVTEFASPVLKSGRDGYFAEQIITQGLKTRIAIMTNFEQPLKIKIFRAFREFLRHRRQEAATENRQRRRAHRAGRD